MSKENWKVIGRGFNGWHAAKKNVSGSGGTLEGYLAEAEEGAFVYDAEKSDKPRFVGLTMNGPMLDAGLPPDAISRFGEKDVESAKRMIPGLQGAFKGMAIKAVREFGTGEQFGSLDKVGIGVYEQLLREVGGVRIGSVTNGKVEWEDA